MSRTSRNEGFSRKERENAILADPLLYEVTKFFPKKPVRTDGEKSENDLGGHWSVYPWWVFFYIKALVHIHGSLRQVDHELRRGRAWKAARKASLRMQPGHPPLPRTPPTLDQINTFTQRYFQTQTMERDGRDYSPADLRTGLASLGTEYAAKLALDLGLCVEDGRGSYTRPSRDKLITGDGKVVTPVYRAMARRRRRRDPETGELKAVIADPDARFHVIGSGTMVFGTDWAIVQARGKGKNRRVILAFAFVDEPDPERNQGGESGVALSLFKRVLPLLPGCQGVVYDGAFHHKHVNPIYQLGVPTTSRLTKGRGGFPNNAFYPHRVEVHLNHPRKIVDPDTGEVMANPEPDPKTIVVINDGSTTGPGSTKVHLESGLPHLCVRNRRGKCSHVAFTDISVARIRTERKSGPPAPWRWYARYSIPPQPWCPDGGWVRLRLDQTDDDRRGKERDWFKRAEYLRAIPGDVDDKTNKALKRVYGQRNDAESGNATLDRSLPGDRAHSVGWERQWLDMFTWGLYRNSLARARWFGVKEFPKYEEKGEEETGTGTAEAA